VDDSRKFILKLWSEGYYKEQIARGIRIRAPVIVKRGSEEVMFFLVIFGAFFILAIFTRSSH